MLTTTSLKTYTHKDLAQMAKKRGIVGWHSMRKDQLIRALVRQSKAQSAASNGSNGRKKKSAPAEKRSAKTRPAAANGARTKSVRAKASAGAKQAPATRKATVSKEAAKPAKPANGRASKRIAMAKAKESRLKDLSIRVENGSIPRANGKKKNGKTNGNAAKRRKDRVVLMVRDSYWLHAYWDLSARSVQRAKAAMAEHWHGAKPVLRLLEVETGSTTNTCERIVRDVEIHGGVKNWYIDVADPPKSYRVAIGYCALDGKFFSILRSNSVTTPEPGVADMVDNNWADVAENCEQVFALSGGYDKGRDNGDLRELFEERLRRPMGSPMVTRFGAGAEGVFGIPSGFELEVSAEMIVFGSTKPDAYVTLAGEPVKLRPDGTFTARLAMPNRRQVLPVVSNSGNGLEQRTVVLAVDRNTKVMEPVVRDSIE